MQLYNIDWGYRGGHVVVKIRKELQMEYGDPRSIAKDFTELAIEGMIRHSERQLVELEAFEIELGETGRASRERSRCMLKINVAKAREALRLRRAK